MHGIGGEWHRSAIFRVLASASLSLAVAACPGDPAVEGDRLQRDRMQGERMKGDPMEGMGAQTSVLAEARLETVPAGRLAWSGHAWPAGNAASASPRRGPAFLYAPDGSHTVAINGRETTLQAGEAVFASTGETYSHQGNGIWEILLGDPDAAPPSGLEQARGVFRSDALEGIPEPPVQVRFVRVDLPPGGRTTVHTHPGAEYVYMTRGTIEYQSGSAGTVRMQPGDDHALPPDTPVQKRNPGGEAAAFLALFIVDPDRPFAPEARFE